MSYFGQCSSVSVPPVSTPLPTSGPQPLRPHSPPGTGKTATLLHFIRAALAALPRGSGPLLATAASNVAVDNLVSGLRALDPSMNVVRVGQPVKVAPELRGVSLEVRGCAYGIRV
jgi:hypothetical protein